MSEPVEFLTVQNRKQPNYKLRFILLILAAAACILLSFVVGRFSINMADVLQILASAFLSAIYGSISYLLSPFPDIQNTVLSLLSQFIVSVDTWDYAMYSVVINIRLPRILAALLVGAALSTAGAAYQGMFQNPLVSPDMLGASAGAGFGACLAIYLSLGSGMVTILAFAGGLIAVLVAYVISRLTKGSATLSMVLAGILVGSLFSASTSYIKLVADTNEQLPEITYWLMGSLAGATMNDVIFAGIIIILGTLPIFLLRWRMNVLTLGEDEAKSMGVNTNRLRFVVIVCATLITAVRKNEKYESKFIVWLFSILNGQKFNGFRHKS